MDRLIENISGALAGFTPSTIEEEGLRRASVALAVYEDETGQPQLVLTKRAPKLNRHAGQWSLPGGRVDAGETGEQAARREMDEEIGLSLPESACLGRLCDYEARSGFAITPFVYWAGRTPAFQPDPVEVARIHAISLDNLAADDAFEFAEDDGLLIRFRYLDRRIHAPTAALLYQFREVCLLGRNTVVSHLRSPGWAK